MAFHKYIFTGFFLFFMVVLGHAQYQGVHLKQGLLGVKYASDKGGMGRDEVRNLLADFPEQLAEYNKGVKQQAIGYPLLWASNVGLYYTLFTQRDNRRWEDYSGFQKSMLIGGIATGIAGLIFAQPGNKKVIWSHKEYAQQVILMSSYDMGDLRPYAYLNRSLYNFSRRKLSLKEHREAMKDVPLALRQFNSSVRLKRMALIVGGVSLGGFIATLATLDTTEDWSDYTLMSKIGIIGGFTGLLGSAGFAIAGEGKRKKAIYTFYEECQCVVQAPNSQYDNMKGWAVGPTNNGMGLVYTF